MYICIHNIYCASRNSVFLLQRSSHCQTELHDGSRLTFSFFLTLLLYFLFIFYFPRCTLSEFSSITSQAYLLFYLFVIEQDLIQTYQTQSSPSIFLSDSDKIWYEGARVCMRQIFFFQNSKRGPQKSETLPKPF